MNSPPLSLRPSPQKSLGEYNYDLFEKDFATDRYTLESKVASAAGGIINFKGVKCQRDGEQYQEVNVQFPWRNYYMWMGTRDNKIKVHVDLGEVNMPQKLGKLNLFTNFKYGDGDTIFRLGAFQKFNNSLCHIRLQHKRSEWSLVQRGTYKYKNIVISDVRNFDISNRQLIQYDILLGYQTNDYDLYLRHYSKSDPSIKLFHNYGIGRIVADVLYRKNDHTFGAEISSGQDNIYKDVQAAVAYSTKVKDVDVKAKFNLRQNTLLLSAKRKINENFGFTIATEVGLKHQTYHSGPCPLPIGLNLVLTP